MVIIMKNSDLDCALECCFKEMYLKKSMPIANQASLNTVLNQYKDKEFRHYLPHTITWKITSACNLKCKHCFYYTEKNKLNAKTDFSTKELLELAEFFIEELNIIRFTITGGEPLLRKDLFKLLTYLKSKNVTIDFQTNATLVNEEIAAKLAKILNPKIDSIQVSLEGANEETHDKTRGTGSFNKTINGIKYLVQNGFGINISYTVTSVNIGELADLYDLCKKLKIKMIALGKFAVCSEEQEYLKPDIEDVFLAVADLINRVNEDDAVSIVLPLLGAFDFLNFDKGKGLLDKHLSQNNIQPCQDLMCHNHGRTNVNWEGKVHLCTVTECDELCLGDLKKQSFFEIWENRFNNVFFQERSLGKSVCKKCKYVNLCRAGCPAAAYLHYGDIHAPNGDCPYGKILMEESREGRQSEASCVK